VQSCSEIVTTSKPTLNLNFLHALAVAQISVKALKGKRVDCIRSFSFVDRSVLQAIGRNLWAKLNTVIN